MADDPTPAPDDEPDAETLAMFARILGKVGPQWLQDQLRATPPANPQSPTPSLESYLRDTLSEMKTTMAETTRRAEIMRELLTPEQLTQFRSALNPPSAPDESHGQRNRNRPQETGPTPAKPKRKWL